MSPKRFVVTMTSYSSGFFASCMHMLSISRSSDGMSGYWAAISRKAVWNSAPVVFITFALCTAVTRLRFSRRASSNANRMIRSDALRVMMFTVSAAEWSRSTQCSTPEYSPSVASRTTTRSVSGKRVPSPAIARAGRTEA